MIVQRIHLPALESVWPWPRLVSPHLAELEQECLDWSASFGAFEPEIQRLVHDKGKLNLLAGMCYARMTRDQLRTGCDIMHLFFMFDEHSDISTPEAVWAQAQIQLDALEHPHLPRPEGEWVGGEFTRQFWLRIPETATPTFRRRFLATWKDYVESVARQAEDRHVKRVLDVDSYFPLRRHTSGAPSTIALYEMDMDIPDEVREHPGIRELETLAVDLIVLANDLLSYNKEQAIGDDGHNIVTVLMRQFNIGMQEAIDEAGELSRQKMNRFIIVYQLLPRWVGPVDLDVQRFVDGMAQCVSGVMHWSYESQRYFGTRGLDVKYSRVLPLLPKVKGGINGVLGPVPVDDCMRPVPVDDCMRPVPVDDCMI